MLSASYNTCMYDIFKVNILLFNNY